MDGSQEQEKVHNDLTIPRLKYQNDLLSALNERLVNSDRMYKMMALSTGDLYVYWNFRHKITELVGPWERVFEKKPDPRSFRVEEICGLLADEEVLLFRERILNMELSGQENSTLLLRFAKGNAKYLCTGTVYYNEKGEPTDKLIGFRSIG